MKKKLLLLLGLLCTSVFSAFCRYEQRPYDLQSRFYEQVHFVPINVVDGYLFEEDGYSNHGLATYRDSSSSYIKYDKVKEPSNDPRDLEFATVEIHFGVISSMGPWVGTDTASTALFINGKKYEFKRGDTYTCFQHLPFNYVHNVSLANYSNLDTLWVRYADYYIMRGDTTYVNIPLIKANNPEWGSVTDSFSIGDYYVGEKLNVQAIPEPGYKFVGWSDPRLNQPLTLEYLELDTLIAIFEPIEKDTTIARDSVFICAYSPDNYRGGYVENEGCRYYQIGDTLDFNAVADTGWLFAGWKSENGSSPFFAERSDTFFPIFIEDTNYVSPTPARDSFWVAVYSSDYYKGTVSGSGWYHKGDTLRLSATPSSKYYKFDSWLSKHRYSTTIATASDTIYGFFDSDSIVVYLKTNDCDAGLVKGNLNWYDPKCDTWDYGYYGDTIRKFAYPQPGYQFVRWESVNGLSVDSFIAIDTLIAIFEPIEKDSIFEPVAKDSVYISIYSDCLRCGVAFGQEVYAVGDTIRKNFEAAPGYKFVGWRSKNNVSVDFASINDTIYAMFEPDSSYIPSDTIEVFIIVSANDTTMGKVYGEGFYNVGDRLYISAEPYPGYKFVRWESSRGLSVNFATEDDEITAIFAPIDAENDSTDSGNNFVSNELADVADPFVNVYTVDGRVIRLHVLASEALVGLKNGTYIVGNKKVRLMN